MEFNILDNSGAFSLYASGGTQALDTLTQSGTGVVVTQDILNEMTYVAPGKTMSASQIAVRDWVTNNPNVVIIDVAITEADAQQYLRGFQPGQNFDAGDVSIMKFADQHVSDGNAYHIITDNYKDFDTLPSILQNKHGFSPDVSVTPSTYGYLSELFYAGEIDKNQYIDLRDSLANSTRAGQVNSSLSLTNAELDAFLPPDVTIDYGTARKMAVLTVVLKEAGFVGDALTFATTAEEVSRLYQNGQTAEAEALMGSYVGGVLGGAGGAFGGAVFAAAILGIFVPEPSTTVAGIVTLVGALAGGVGGGMAGEALAQDIIEGLQARLANGEPILLDDVIDIVRSSDSSCFGPEVPIDMWPLDPDLKPGPDGNYDQDEVRARIWKKPIELIRVGDLVVSFDDDGNLVPGPVTRTFQNNAKILLNFHGTRVTPGHVYYRPDSKKSYKYETLIDVLRDDGVIKHQDGTLIRAATNVPVDSPRDGFVKAVAGRRKADGTFEQTDQGRIRLGTRFLVGEGEERKSFAVAGLIEHNGGVVGEDELIYVGDGPGVPFIWDFADTLPKPEDFVLACSGTTLEDIYKAAEWESQGPRLPAPMVLDRGPVQPLKGAALSAMPRNEPLNVAHAPMASAKPQRTLNRKQRKAMEAKQRKAAKSGKRVAV